MSLTIGKRITLGFGVVLAITLGLGLYAYVRVVAMNGEKPLDVGRRLGTYLRQGNVERLRREADGVLRRDQLDAGVAHVEGVRTEPGGEQRDQDGKGEQHHCCSPCLV